MPRHPEHPRRERDSGPPRNREFRKPGRQAGQTLAKATLELNLLYGYHAVREALRAGRRKLIRLHATSGAAEKLAPEIAASKVPLSLATADDIARTLEADAVHQGLLLEARPLPVIDISEIVNRTGLLLVLDQVTDPHNVGAILRTAAAFAIDALVVTERHSPEFSGILAKAASGGLEHVPIAAAGNLSRALTELGEMGYLRIGLDSDGTADLSAIPMSAPLALVLGAEGKGLRRLTRERCDAIARLEMPGPVKSLNVSNACAIALSIARSRVPIPG